tara:strand:+ start:638 stop:790 length:153 start_codon:yes stop_codon:yes gene_type:complete
MSDKMKMYKITLNITEYVEAESRQDAVDTIEQESILDGWKFNVEEVTNEQ